MQFGEATTYQASSFDEPKATIVYPPPDRMRIRLANIEDVDALSRLQGDVNTWYTILGISAGGAVGILVTWVTNITGTGAWAITPAAVVALIAFVIFSLTFVFFAWKHGKRADDLRRKIYAEATSDLDGAGFD